MQSSQMASWFSSLFCRVCSMSLVPVELPAALHFSHLTVVTYIYVRILKKFFNSYAGLIGIDHSAPNTEYTKKS